MVQPLFLDLYTAMDEPFCVLYGGGGEGHSSVVCGDEWEANEVSCVEVGGKCLESTGEFLGF